MLKAVQTVSAAHLITITLNFEINSGNETRSSGLTGSPIKQIIYLKKFSVQI